MSTTSSIPVKGPDSGSSGTTHSKEAALSEREFELLYESCYDLNDPYALQCRFLVLVGGRLSLRAGEIAHMAESWIDWDAQMIQIPAHDACWDSQHGTKPCSYCIHKAFQKAQNTPVPYGDCLAARWHPKTDAAVRQVPFGWSPRACIVIEQFFERWDRWPHTRQSINRRVDRAADASVCLDRSDIWPHGLRATAATNLVAKGLSASPLKQMLGWSKLATAQKYLQTSGDRTGRALRDIHSR